MICGDFDEAITVVNNNDLHASNIKKYVSYVPAPTPSPATFPKLGMIRSLGFLNL